ncbi:MAG: hypothetical protein ACJAT2_002288 [Bacteriovoracaceae bacterium]|jgi:hypothetical protein
MVGSSFSLSEALLYYEDFDDLLKSESSILHSIFATTFRTFMPLYLFPILYYLDQDFFNKKRLSLYLFYIASFFLIFNNFVIYGIGAYVFIAIKHLVLGTAEVVRDEAISHLNPMYDLIYMLLNDVLNAIYKPILEVIRGFSLIMVFNAMKVDIRYSYLGVVILLFDMFVIMVSFLSFLGFELTYIDSYDFTEYSMIGFQYWIVIGLSYLVYMKRKNNREELV